MRAYPIVRSDGYVVRAVDVRLACGHWKSIIQEIALDLGVSQAMPAHYVRTKTNKLWKGKVTFGTIAKSATGNHVIKFVAK